MKVRGAFTLVELLAVVAILMLLVSLLMPSLQRAKELANRTVCRGNMRVFNQSILQYASDYQGWAAIQHMHAGGGGPYGLSSEYPQWQPFLGPYYGMSTDPKPMNSPENQKQPWYGNTACPSYRKGHAIMQTTLAFAPNTVLCKHDTNINLFRIADPTRVFLTCEAKYAYQASGYGDAFATCRGDMSGNQIGTYPRHLAEGLDWGFVDGHVSWLPYYKSPTGFEMFLPETPRKKD